MGQGGFGGPDSGSMSGGMSDFMQVIQNVAPAGKRVSKGQLVAEFDRQYQLIRLDDYRSSVEQNERSYKSLDANIDVQRKAHDLSIAQAAAAVDKAKLDIKTIPVRSQIETELLKLQLEEAEARLKQLQREVPFQRETERTQRRIADLQMAQSRSELKRAEQNVDKMLVTAPMDGLLVMETTRRGSEFAQIQQGDQLFPGQMFARIVDTSSMLVSATVNQADVESLRINARATLRFDAYPDLSLPAHVVSIGAIAATGGFRANYVKEIPVFLKLDRIDPRVIPDLSVSVDVEIESSGDGVLIPVESIFSESGKDFVYVRSTEGFVKRQIDLGIRNHVKAVVKSGVREGEVLAVDPPAQPAQPKGTARRGAVQDQGAINV
jgi:biotin carboxyl carrier protein